MERKTIGIDLGHCETAMAFPRQPDVNDSRYEVRRLVGEKKDQVVATQLILTNEQMKKLSGHKRPEYSLLSGLGEIRIGNKLPAYVPDGEKFCYFKVPPKYFDRPYGNTECAKECGITHGMLMACFAFALVRNIFLYNVGDLSENDRKETDLLIGCPTTRDWTSQEAQIEYGALIKKATNVHAVRIVPESRAAMFSSVENEKIKVSALKGAVVFDFGSSTADCTYMLLGRKMIEFSWGLGASEIERQMTMAAYQKAVETNGAFHAAMTSIADVEDELRTAKESYFDHRFPPKGHPIICSFEREEDGMTVDQMIRIDDPFMKQVTAERPIHVLCDSKNTVSGSWEELCLAFFREARERISQASYTFVDASGKKQTKQCEIDTIVLTGGASRMEFIAELCREAFPEAKIQKEDNPSHTVSNGLGWVAVSDANLESCRNEARKLIDSRKSCSITALKENLESKIFDLICQTAEKCTQEWADAPGDNLSLQDLQKKITTEMNRAETKNKINAACAQIITEWKKELSSAMEEAVNGQVGRLYSEKVARGLMIPTDVWETLQAGNMKLDQMDVSNILKGIDVSSIARQIAQWAIIAAATGVGAIFGPVGGTIGFFAGLVAAAFIGDDKLEEKRPRKKRQSAAATVKKKIRESKVQLMQEFQKDFSRFESEYSKHVDQSLTAAFEIVSLKRFSM